MITRADEIEALRAGVERLDKLTQENAELAVTLREALIARDSARRAFEVLRAEMARAADASRSRIEKAEAQVDILRTVILAALVKQ